MRMEIQTETGFSFFLHTQRNVGLLKSIRRESGFPLLSRSFASGYPYVYHPDHSLAKRLFSTFEVCMAASGYKYPGVYGWQEKTVREKRLR